MGFRTARHGKGSIAKNYPLTTGEFFPYDGCMAKQTSAEKQVVGLSITLGVLVGGLVGFLLGEWLVACAMGAAVGFLLGVVLTSEHKKKGKKRR